MSCTSDNTDFGNHISALFGILTFLLRSLSWIPVRWVIKHSASDYKTGKSYGERPPMVIASFIYPELEAFITTWRAELKPQHDYLFTRQNGQPFDSNKLAGVFRSAAFRLTGKKTNPHLVRDMIVTYLR